MGGGHRREEHRRNHFRRQQPGEARRRAAVGGFRRDLPAFADARRPEPPAGGGGRVGHGAEDLYLHPCVSNRQLHGAVRRPQRPVLRDHFQRPLRGGQGVQGPDRLDLCVGVLRLFRAPYLFQKYGEGAAHQLYGRDAERDGGPDQPGGRRQLRHGGPRYQPAHGL